jgi:hypothetical protein
VIQTSEAEFSYFNEISIFTVLLFIISERGGWRLAWGRPPKCFASISFTEHNCRPVHFHSGLPPPQVQFEPGSSPARTPWFAAMAGGGLNVAVRLKLSIIPGSETIAVNFKMSADVKQSAATDPTKATYPALLLHFFCCRFLFSQLMVSPKHLLFRLIQFYAGPYATNRNSHRLNGHEEERGAPHSSPPLPPPPSFPASLN